MCRNPPATFHLTADLAVTTSSSTFTSILSVPAPVPAKYLATKLENQMGAQAIALVTPNGKSWIRVSSKVMHVVATVGIVQFGARVREVYH